VKKVITDTVNEQPILLPIEIELKKKKKKCCKKYKKKNRCGSCPLAGCA
jgi:hypothetical protein